MKAKFPSYGVGDIAKELGQRWGKCTEKPRFEAMAAKDKKRYEAVSYILWLSAIHFKTANS